MKTVIRGIVFVVLYTLLGCLLKYVFKTEDPYIYAFSYCLFGGLFEAFKH